MKIFFTKYTLSFLFVSILASQIVWGQDTSSSIIKLPFAIANEKMLSDEDLSNKKEGTYFAGVPEISSDPINGFGYGVEGSVIFNGKRTDPFFAYTPYRKQLDVVLFNTSKNQREIALKLDVPYIFDSKWRLRVEAAYEVNPNLLYFGTTEKSLKPLSYYPNNDSTQNPVTNARYKDYSKALETTNGNYNNSFYNGYTKEEYIFNMSGERSYMDGKLRLLAGIEAAWLNITTFDGKTNKHSIDPVTGQTSYSTNAPTRISQDFNNGSIVGVGKNFVDFLQVGIVYDTRDLEPDPGKGIFAELTNEFSNKALGSAFNFNKTFVQVKVYKKLFPSVFKKLIFASRIGFGYTAGNAPFFEYQDQWSSEGSIEGLGGANTIRGYKQGRFLGRVMDFANFELRCRFIQGTVFKQHIALSAVPLFDVGGVWDNLSRLNKINNYRYSEGLGMRVAWNVSTILRFDYAVSKEDNQFFFTFSHAF
ncbi:MAG TPA: DUF5982 domain-containing protein [Cytophagaceae bacterium]|jgi:hypothetical protein|nr:DUF5982 domain-containing protein [Cytophagaceae bacterium]